MDRSEDKTLEILKRIASADTKTQVLALSSRFGHQMSLLAGIDHAGADAAVMMDSDLQHPPELIPRMLDYFEQGYEVVYTLREEGDETELETADVVKVLLPDDQLDLQSADR